MSPCLCILGMIVANAVVSVLLSFIQTNSIYKKFHSNKRLIREIYGYERD
jgi:hypothetical protein